MSNGAFLRTTTTIAVKRKDGSVWSIAAEQGAPDNPKVGDVFNLGDNSSGVLIGFTAKVQRIRHDYVVNASGRVGDPPGKRVDYHRTIDADEI